MSLDDNGKMMMLVVLECLRALGLENRNWGSLSAQLNKNRLIELEEYMFWAARGIPTVPLTGNLNKSSIWCITYLN